MQTLLAPSAENNRPASTRSAEIPETVNYHLNRNCNFRCKGCYATFNDDPAARGVMLPRAQMFSLVEAIAALPLSAGASHRKLTFAGGEPTLCPWLPELIAHASQSGLGTMLVTNGSRCTPAYLDRIAPSLDWLTVSIDSLDADTNRHIGRHGAHGIPLSSEEYRSILDGAAERGLRTKVNTVVNRANWREDFTTFLAAVEIARWKILQVVPVGGQNDDHIAELTITRAQFDAFVGRHAALAARMPVIAEPVELIRGSYAMIDPAGRFFDSSRGFHFYSRPILDAGAPEAFAEVTFDRARFEQRGGNYSFA